MATLLLLAACASNGAPAPGRAESFGVHAPEWSSVESAGETVTKMQPMSGPELGWP